MQSLQVGTQCLKYPLFDIYTGNSCGLFFCSDPCEPPVCLPPDTSLASVQERCSSVSEHSVRSPNCSASFPTGIWLLHPASAIAAVHSPSGQPAALGICEGLKRPRRWTLWSQLFWLSHIASGLRKTQCGPKRTFFSQINSWTFPLCILHLPQTPPNLSNITFFTVRFAVFGFAMYCTL